MLRELVETHRARQRLLRAQTVLTQQMGAYCRRLCGGDKVEGAKLLRAVEGTTEHPLLELASGACVWLLRAREALHPGVRAHEKRIRAIVESLPIWTEWGEAIFGLGALGLGQIIGECVSDNAASPGAYRTLSGLWKRMGVGMVSRDDGSFERQRRVAGEAALEHGYDPSRRSVLYNVGASILKKRASSYRAVYDTKRAEYEQSRPEWTKGRRHLAAQRYMEKQILKDLWLAWRRTAKETQPVQITSVATPEPA